MPATAWSGGELGHVGQMTVEELTAAAQLRRVGPSSLLPPEAQARAGADIALVTSLPAPAARLALDLARLHPAAVAVLAPLVERCAAVDQRRRGRGGHLPVFPDIPETPTKER